MSRQLNGSIELSALKHYRMKTKKGTMGTFIPDELNYADVVRKGEETRVFIPIIQWINDEENAHGQIASIKQSLPTAIYNADKEKAKELSKDLPYLGNLKDFSGGSNQATGAISNETFEAPEADDLPF